ncbi:hypothetical protein HDN1F_18270 [gamma proteobacterium HdN1]|nr:hypothetical protein HDN1F_18270 [gamma proteobacterium HdN1]
MFILPKDKAGNKSRNQSDCWEAYQEYLLSVSGRLPASAYDFASAEWHYNFLDHRCPHDAWVESITIYEDSIGDRSEIRQLHIKTTLLGAYHDGYIEIVHIDVKKYRINSDSFVHGDWLYDEVRLGDDGAVVHEIEFSKANLYVECSDIRSLWVPK